MTTTTCDRTASRAGAPLLRALLPLAIAGAPLLLLAAGCTDDCGAPSIAVQAPASAKAGQTLALTPTLAWSSGDGCGDKADTTFALSVTGGGGSAPTQVKAGTSFDWKLGPAPIAQALQLKAAGSGAEAKTLEVVAALDAPVAATPFADVNAWMTAEGVAGSTEDLAFTPKGDAVLLGIPGGLIEVSAQGKISRRTTSGDPLVGPLGIAFDRQGQLWVADGKGEALRKVSPQGVVSTPLTADADKTALQGPNYVAIDRSDRVLLTDPCIGRLMRYDDKKGAVDARESFNPLTEGGPNGVALDPEGRWLYVLTENTALLCPKAKDKPDVQAPIAGLFRLELTDAGFGPHETVQAGIGVFGDGMAFDVEGNLYVIGDTVENFALKESFISVLRKGESALVPFVSTTGRVFANVAFGQGAYGDTSLYIALLAVPPFTKNTMRGMMKVEVGVRGLPLL